MAKEYHAIRQNKSCLDRRLFCSRRLQVGFYVKVRLPKIILLLRTDLSSALDENSWGGA